MDSEKKPRGRPVTTGRGVNPQIKIAVSFEERERLKRFGKTAGLRRAIASLGSHALWIDPEPGDLPNTVASVVPAGASRVVLLASGKTLPVEFFGAEEADTPIGKVAWLITPR